MIRNATYNVTTTNGKHYIWRFEECIPDKDDYGNKMYILYFTPSNDRFLIDCRYMKQYNFTKICVEFLLNYYGKNLDELYEVESND